MLVPVGSASTTIAWLPVYEVLRNGAWEQVKNGIPRRTDRIRLLE